MIEFVHQGANGLPWKGSWFEDKDSLVHIVCPKCGGAGVLDQHNIKTDGTVEPSVVCPCGFHEFIKLKDFGQHERSLWPER